MKIDLVEMPTTANPRGLGSLSLYEACPTDHFAYAAKWASAGSNCYQNCYHDDIVFVNYHQAEAALHTKRRYYALPGDYVHCSFNPAKQWVNCAYPLLASEEEGQSLGAEESAMFYLSAQDLGHFYKASTDAPSEEDCDSARMERRRYQELKRIRRTRALTQGEQEELVRARAEIDYHDARDPNVQAVLSKLDSDLNKLDIVIQIGKLVEKLGGNVRNATVHTSDESSSI